MLWIVWRILFIVLLCCCGYNRAYKITSEYHKLFESNSFSSGSLSEPHNKIKKDYSKHVYKDDWWSLYYSSINSSGVIEKIKQIQRENDEKKILKICKCCNFDTQKQTIAQVLETAQQISSRTKLVIYRTELENVEEFEQFQDFLKTFDFYFGKLFANNKNTLEALKVGSFKGNIMFYPSENDHLVNFNGKDLSNGVLNENVDNNRINVTIRVYIVRAYGLHPKDRDGKCDPYIVIKTPFQEINDRKNYVHNQINPYFGRYFEVQGSFPDDHRLTIEIKDQDPGSKDDLIGKTDIDLESRFYSKHRGSCGLAKLYDATWRDQLKPTQLLEELCDRHEIGYPVYFEDSVIVGNKEFILPSLELVEDLKEELALLALNRWQEVPLVGYHLVPQHIESRTLYDTASQGVSQGILEIWIDIFATDYGWIPPPVDIALRKPEEYELRVIIWNTADVQLMDDAYFTGEKHSDIYVKGWLAGKEDVQQTDVHYRSDGEGYFNWRFIFFIKYFPAEAMMLVSRKGEEFRIPPKIHLQVWDNDNFSADDYIGSLVLDLSHMPRGARLAKRCTIDIIKETAPTLNLFQIKRTRGWWPFQLGGNGPERHSMVGKLEAEFHILSKEEATQNPAGNGRKEPEALPIPIRPDRFNFHFIWTPFRVLLGIVKSNKGKLAIFAIVFSLIVFTLLFIYAFPGYSAKAILGV